MILIKILLYIAIGALAGWLAGKVMKGKGFGFVLNLILGIVGSFLGGFILGIFNLFIGGGLIGSLITAFTGAVILLAIGNILHGRK